MTCSVVVLSLNSNMRILIVIMRLLVSLLFLVALTGGVVAAAEKVNINTASVEEFVTLKGIGPAKAKTIVEYRKENGPFKTIEQLAEVRGIGPKTLANIKDNLTLGASPSALGQKGDAATDKASDAKQAGDAPKAKGTDGAKPQASMGTIE